MVGMSLEEFEQYVIAVCSNSSVVQSVVLFDSTPTSVRLRVFLINQSFLDVFYNQKTGKFSFALIEKYQRVFGADNAGDKWHWHPVENPEIHVPAAEEVTFREFLKRLEDNSLL
ncbi:MAG: hypothetical protein KJ606_10660 [Chloroflexi bacterium]|nr:hypothetical protein [Chloroflexota bacterium]